MGKLIQVLTAIWKVLTWLATPANSRTVLEVVTGTAKIYAAAFKLMKTHTKSLVAISKILKEVEEPILEEIDAMKDNNDFFHIDVEEIKEKAETKKAKKVKEAYAAPKTEKVKAKKVKAVKNAYSDNLLGAH